MKTIRPIPMLLVFLMFFITFACSSDEQSFESDWHQQVDRVWVGQDMWANRLQDWRLKEGQLQCVNSTLPLRTVHLLTHRISDHGGETDIELTIGLNRLANRQGSEGWGGILLGAGEDLLDYRSSALIHHSPGKTGGIIVAVNENGQLVFLDNTRDRDTFGNLPAMPASELPDSLLLRVNIYPGADHLFTISASATDPATGDLISSNTLTSIEQVRLLGNIAIAANHIEEKLVDHTYWFSRLKVSGKTIAKDASHRFGPVLGVQYTLNKGTMKLTAQMPPVGEKDERYVKLWTREKGAIEWALLDSSTILHGPYIASFSEQNWDATKETDYRLTYRVNDIKGRKRTIFYTGTIGQEPVEKEEIVVGAFSCISHSHGSIDGTNFDYTHRLWFPHTEITSAVAAQKADILFFTGDQVYEGRPTAPDLSSPGNTELDYLYKWFLFLWTVNDLTRNIPSVCIPDDHDVYHGNLWGEGGKKAPSHPRDTIYPDHYKNSTGYWQQDQGGYKLRAATVNMIQATQTSHLPDPFDSTPVEQGIGVYYTDLNYGRISFAILEDRKFKSAPSQMIPEAKVVNGFQQNRYIYGRNLDHPDAKLLGDRQLDFLAQWTEDWLHTDMKATISQTIFANLSTLPSTFSTDEGTSELESLPAGVIPEGYRIAKDMDSNGWPQSGRNKALKIIRKGFPVMIGGDQHLGSLIQMGVERWDDAGYSFCVPAIGNLWPRRWFPPEAGRDHVEGNPQYTGKYFDGFGNRMNVWAVANPAVSGKSPSALYDRAAGYGIIRFNKSTGEITFECWKRGGDPGDPEGGMYTGWPHTIHLLDNYDRTIRSWLPNYQVSGLPENPVFQVIDESNGETLFTVRIPGDTYQPGVFDYSGSYTVKIGDPDSEIFQVFEGVRSSYKKPVDIVPVNF